MKKAMLVTTSITALLGLSACSSSFDLESGKSQILEADKRLFLVKNQTGPFPGLSQSQEPGQSPKNHQDGRYLGSEANRLVCAEPSPDAITTQAISAALRADVMGRGGGALGGGYAESAASIAARTAAVQVLRDIQYRACEALMNGVVGPQHYKQILAAAAYTTIGLVAVDGLGRGEMAKASQIGSQVPVFNISTTPNNGADAPKKEKPDTGVQTPNAGGDQKGADAKTVMVSITAGSSGTSTQNAPSEGNKAPSEGNKAPNESNKAPNESDQETGWPPAGEMARALCLTTIASPAGVDVRLRAEELARNATQQSGNGNNLDYKDVKDLTQTCMTGLAPEKKAEESTGQSPRSRQSEVVARK